MEEELTMNKQESSSEVKLSEELLEKSKEELGETDNIREESLSLLKEWILTHNNDYSNLGILASVLFFKCSFSLI